MNILKKKTVVLVVLTILCLILTLVLVRSNTKPVTENSSYPPNIMIDDTLYWFAAAYMDFDLPNDYILVGTVQENISGVSDKNFAANGVATGSQIYQSDEHPGWLFVNWDQYYNLFTTWELGCALLKYNDSIYISADDFKSNLEAEAYPSLEVESFSKDYQFAGTLHMEGEFYLPCEEFGINCALFDGGRLYFSPNKPSTLYVEAGEGNTIWKEAFYQVSMIPLDISKYK